MSDTTPTPGKPTPPAKSPAAAPEGPTKPTPAAAPPGGGPAPKLPPGGRGSDKPSDFRVIRSAPPPEPAATNMLPLVIGLLVVIGLAVGGYMVSRGGSTEGDPTRTTEAATKGVDAPEFEKLQYLIDEQRYEEALEYALEKQKDYPSAPNLKATIADLRERTGQAAPASPDEVMATAAKRIEAKQFDLALEELGSVDEEALTDAQKGKLKFLVARASAGLGNKLDALNALEEAQALGYPAAEVQKLRDQLDKPE